MGKKAITSFFSVCSISFAIGSSALALEKPFPDLNRDAAFRNVVETALVAKKNFFVFEQDGVPRQFIIDYDPSFIRPSRTRPEPEEFRTFLSHLVYEGSEVKSSVNDRMEYRAFLNVKSPKVEDWESQTGQKWDGIWEDFQGSWDEKHVFSFNFFLTALDDEEEESEVLYLDDQGRIKMGFYIQVTGLVHKLQKEKIQLAEDAIFDLNRKISEAETYKDEIIQLLLNHKYESLYMDFMAARKKTPTSEGFQRWTRSRSREAGETKYQEYLQGLRLERQARLEVLLAKSLFTTSVIEYVKEFSGLPEKAICQIMSERKL